MIRVSSLLLMGLLVSCDTTPPGGAGGPCSVADYRYVEFEELVQNLPRYVGADIIVDGYVKAGPRRCRDESTCDCSADPLLHDGRPRDTVPNQFLLAPGAGGTPFACRPASGCQMSCTPGPNVAVRVLGRLDRVVEEEGEAVINVFKACPI